MLLLFIHGKSRFSHDVAQLVLIDFEAGNHALMCVCVVCVIK